MTGQLRGALLALLSAAARCCRGNVALSGLGELLPGAEGVYAVLPGGGVSGRRMYRQVPPADAPTMAPRFLFFAHHQWAVGRTPGAAPYELAVRSRAASPDVAARGAGKVWVVLAGGLTRPAAGLRVRCVGNADSADVAPMPAPRTVTTAVTTAVTTLAPPSAAPAPAGPCSFVKLHLGFSDVEGDGDSITRDTAAPALVRCGGYYSLQRSLLPRLVWRQLYFPYCQLYKEAQGGGRWVVSKVLWKPPQLLVAPHAAASSPDRVRAGSWQALDRKTVLYRPAPTVTVSCAPTPAPTPAPATTSPTPPPSPDGTLLPPPPTLSPSTSSQATLVHCVSACRSDGGSGVPSRCFV